jgi:hypothetical protein
VNPDALDLEIAKNPVGEVIEVSRLEDLDLTPPPVPRVFEPVLVPPPPNPVKPTVPLAVTYKEL